MHLLDVKRFTGPLISALNFDQSRLQNEDTISIPRRSRLNSLKPMIKNFEVGHRHPTHGEQIQTKDACNLNKTLYDYQVDTKDIEQPAMFTEYIRKYCYFFHEHAMTRSGTKNCCSLSWYSASIPPSITTVFHA